MGFGVRPCFSGSTSSLDTAASSLSARAIATAASSSSDTCNETVYCHLKKRYILTHPAKYFAHSCLRTLSLQAQRIPTSNLIHNSIMVGLLHQNFHDHLKVVLQLRLCATGSERECVNIVQGECQHEVPFVPGQPRAALCLSSVKARVQVSHSCHFHPSQCLQHSQACKLYLQEQRR